MRRSGPSLTSKGYSDKAAKISCARDQPTRTFFDVKLNRKLKENRATDSLKVARQRFGKPTKRYIAKEVPSFVNVPLGLGGKINQKVYREGGSILGLPYLREGRATVRVANARRL